MLYLFLENCKILKLTEILTFFEQQNCLKELNWVPGACLETKEFEN